MVPWWGASGIYIEEEISKKNCTDPIDTSDIFRVAVRGVCGQILNH